MDQPHALVVVVIVTPMVCLPIFLLSAVLIALDVLTFQWIVDIVVVIRVFHDFVPIEYLADVARLDSALPRFRAFLEAKRGQVK